MEQIHKARIFDIAAGMGVSLDSSIKTVNARSLELLKKADGNFRAFIDSSTPSVYPINILKDVAIPLITAYALNITAEVLATEIEIELKNISANITVAELSNKITTATEAASLKIASLQGKKATHLDYRNVFYTLGSELKTLFSARVVLKVSDPINMGIVDKAVFIGNSFSGLRDNINKAINKVLRNYTEDKKASYGSVMAAGHTAVALENGTYGTNTPLLQRDLFRLEASNTKVGSFSSISDAFVKKVPLFIENTIVFNENFTPVAKNMLNIGFTFVVPMPSAANSSSGTTESKAIKEILANVVLPGLVEAMKQRVSWLKDHILVIKGSPTVIDYLSTLFSNTLQSKPIPTSIYTDTKKTKTKILSSVVSSTLKFTASKGAKTTKLTPIRTTSGQFYSLTSLQALINTHLQDVVAANMGNGGDSRVLNYRSGRFAESTKVERMSQSREGMITAFYSYMKNPYQTFEPGYKQGKPLSRDPKLLIGKSIKEIAATKVGNRLRAILI